DGRCARSRKPPGRGCGSRPRRWDWPRTSRRRRSSGCPAQRAFATCASCCARLRASPPAPERRPCAMAWRGSLAIDYRLREGRTIAHDRHDGPLRVLRALHPEGGVCHSVLVHPPGGVVGGRVLATMWFASGDALDPVRSDALLDVARAAAAPHPLAATTGATSPQPGVIVVRALAERVEPAMELLQRIWRAWRPLAWGLAA